jgi:hypothetical protein
MKMTPDTRQACIDLLNAIKVQGETMSQIRRLGVEIDPEKVTPIGKAATEILCSLLLDYPANGLTMTDWWLYSRVEKVLYSGGVEVAKLESAEQFVDYMINRTNPVKTP